jgi:hypothetical protein
MKKLAFTFLISFFLLSILIVQNGNIPTANASVYEGDLVINGNIIYTIENQRFDINGSILVEENATLILRNTRINFTGSSQGIRLQNSANGKAKLQADNATIMNDFSDNRLYGNSSATLSNCTLSGFYMHNEANATITNSTINFIQARNSPTLSLANSAIYEMDIVSKYANVSITNLFPGFIAFWDFWLNCSLTLSPSGEAPHITFMDTSVTRWSFSFQPTSASEIINSQIWHLHANGPTHISIFDTMLNAIELYGSSVVELTNSTHTEPADLLNEAKVCVYWYADIHVLDSTHIPVPSANVTTIYPNATTAGLNTTGTWGWARLTLMEKTINITGTYPVGNYTIKATYEIHSTNTTVNMSMNKHIILYLDFVIPEFPSQLIALLFITTTLLITLAYRKKRITKLIQYQANLV